MARSLDPGPGRVPGLSVDGENQCCLYLMFSSSEALHTELTLQCLLVRHYSCLLIAVTVSISSPLINLWQYPPHTFVYRSCAPSSASRGGPVAQWFPRRSLPQGAAPWALVSRHEVYNVLYIRKTVTIPPPPPSASKPPPSTLLPEALLTRCYVISSELYTSVAREGGRVSVGREGGCL